MIDQSCALHRMTAGSERRQHEPSDEDPLPYQTMQQLRKEAAAQLTETLQRRPTAAQLQKEVDRWLQLFAPFNLADAVAVWVRHHRAAVTAWVSDPFWP